MDTAGPLYNLHYLNGLGPPRSPITKNSRRLLWSNDSERRRINPAANLPDWTIHMPFYSGRQPATLLRSALKVLESAKYPTIQFRHMFWWLAGPRTSRLSQSAVRTIPARLTAGFHKETS
jgi:hypothetical protein